MKTLKEMFTEFGEEKTRRILTCGATHIAQDNDGCVYAYRSKPVAGDNVGLKEWVGSRDNQVVLFCAELERPADWTKCVWELP